MISVDWQRLFLSLSTYSCTSYRCIRTINMYSHKSWFRCVSPLFISFYIWIFCIWFSPFSLFYYSSISFFFFFFFSLSSSCLLLTNQVEKESFYIPRPGARSAPKRIQATQDAVFFYFRFFFSLKGNKKIHIPTVQRLVFDNNTTASSRYSNRKSVLLLFVDPISRRREKKPN